MVGCVEVRSGFWRRWGLGERLSYFGFEVVVLREVLRFEWKRRIGGENF